VLPKPAARRVFLWPSSAKTGPKPIPGLMYVTVQTMFSVAIKLGTNSQSTALDREVADVFLRAAMPPGHRVSLRPHVKESLMKTINLCRHKELARTFLAIACLSAVAGLAGCEQQKDTTDRAEEKVDRAAETAEQKIGQAKDQAEREIDAAKESATDTGRMAGVAVDDSAITARVNSAILADPLLKDSHIQVNTVNGVVTLSGTVNDEPDVARAVEVANTQKDVKSVQNTLVVKVVPDKM